MFNQRWRKQERAWCPVAPLVVSFAQVIKRKPLRCALATRDGRTSVHVHRMHDAMRLSNGSTFFGKRPPTTLSVSHKTHTRGVRGGGGEKATTTIGSRALVAVHAFSFTFVTVPLMKT